MSGIKWDAESVTRAIRCVRDGLAKNVAVPVLRRASTKIASFATTKYMRRDTLGRRRPDDSGPLRRQTTQLARSLTGSRFHGSGSGREAINKLTLKAGVTTLAKGSRTIYSAIHEFGFKGEVNVPAHTRSGHSVKAHRRSMDTQARPYLNPALKDASPGITRDLQKTVTTFVRKCLDKIKRGTP